MINSSIEYRLANEKYDPLVITATRLNYGVIPHRPVDTGEFCMALVTNDNPFYVVAELSKHLFSDFGGILSTNIFHYAVPSMINDIEILYFPTVKLVMVDTTPIKLIDLDLEYHTFLHTVDKLNRQWTKFIDGDSKYLAIQVDSVRESVNLITEVQKSLDVVNIFSSSKLVPFGNRFLMYFPNIGVK